MDNKNIFIKSLPGTGKSTTMINWISDTWQDKKILYISMRVSFSHNIQKTMAKKNINFELYSDIEGQIIPENHPRLICQVESLNRIDLHFSQYDVIIFDEWVGILTHISPKYKDDSISIYTKKIKQII